MKVKIISIHEYIIANSLPFLWLGVKESFNKNRSRTLHLWWEKSVQCVYRVYNYECRQILALAAHCR